MSKREDKPKQKTEISGALDDKDIEKVTGGDKASPKKVTSVGPTEQISLSFGKLGFKYNEQ